MKDNMKDDYYYICPQCSEYHLKSTQPCCEVNQTAYEPEAKKSITSVLDDMLDNQRQFADLVKEFKKLIG